MNHPRLPRTLVILLFTLIAATFLAGTLRSFASAQAAAILEDATPMNSLHSGEALAPTLTTIVNFPTLKPTLTAPTASLLPPATGVSTSMPTPAPTPTPTSAPIPPQESSTDMTGIISLAIVLVVVILVGVTWSGLSSRKKKEPK